MRDFNEISLLKFVRTLNNLAILTKDNNDLCTLIQQLVSSKCRLAKEMLIFMERFREETGEYPMAAIEHYNAIVVLWFLLNDYNPLAMDNMEVKKCGDQEK